jgi:hypothetical protein
VGAGALMILIAGPLIRRKIKPNPWYGFRVRATLENPEIWYEVNEMGGRGLRRAGVGILIAALLLYLIPGLNKDAYALLCTAVMGALLAVMMVESFRRLNMLTKSRRPGDLPKDDMPR